MIATNLIDAACYVAIILAAGAPAIWLLCAATDIIERVVAISLLVISLVGYMGLDAIQPARPEPYASYSIGEQ